ncbi:MAG TPA: hypothetical protein VK902_10915 [Rubrobacter sp.]|nr:hypothetical protein [Rubrobacter sp.]
MTYTESVAVEDYRGQRLLPRQSVQLPGFEVPGGAEDEVEGVLALVGVPVPPGVHLWNFSSPGHPGASEVFSAVLTR